MAAAVDDGDDDGKGSSTSRFLGYHSVDASCADLWWEPGCIWTEQ